MCAQARERAADSRGDRAIFDDVGTVDTTGRRDHAFYVALMTRVPRHAPLA